MPRQRARTNAITLTVTAPPRELSPNRVVNCHRMKRAKLRKEHREIVTYDVLPLCGQGLTHAAVQCTIYHKDMRGLLDPDNALAWLKTVFDGLTDAGIFADDKELTHLPVKQIVDKERAGTVDVRIDPCEGGEG